MSFRISRMAEVRVAHKNLPSSERFPVLIDVEPAHWKLHAVVQQKTPQANIVLPVGAAPQQ
jgi:hypothetical protein